jgi:hypothetical protein
MSDEGGRPRRGGEATADVGRESEEFFRYCSELMRRIGRGGVTDIPHLLNLYERLRCALDAVSVQEIIWAEERARELLEKLMRVNATLQTLRRLKTAVAHDGGREEATTDVPAPSVGPHPR